MNSAEVITDKQLLESADDAFYDGCVRTADELRLMLLELLCKASAGRRNSYTESIFLGNMNLLKRDGTANKQGREFIMKMVYSHSNLRADCYDLMTTHRHPF